MSKKTPKKYEICPNCEQSLDEAWEFCPGCGQSVYEVPGTLKYMFKEISGSLYSFDSKFFQTVGNLFVRPGMVASEYISGKMMRYVPPFKIFIFTSIVFFLIVSFRSCSSREKEQSDTSADAQIFYNSTEMVTADLALIKEYNRHQLDSFIVSYGDEANFFNRNIVLTMAKISENGTSAFVDEIIANAALGMFLLMPLSAYILYLFYRKKRKYYFDHLIAAVYLHTAIFILFIVNQILSMITGFELILFILFLFYIYFIWSLRNFYASQWKTAIGRSIPIVLIYGIFLFIFMIGVTMTSIFTF